MSQMSHLGVEAAPVAPIVEAASSEKISFSTTTQTLGHGHDGTREPLIKGSDSTPHSHYPVLDADAQEKLHKKYHPNKQLWDLFKGGLLHWMVTVVLLVLLGITIWAYHMKKVLNHGDRKWFNAVSTGLSIAIGLAIATSLQGMAMNMRWWFLSLQRMPLRTVDTILKYDILNPKTYFVNLVFGLFAFLWLLINIASQVGVASFGLVMSVDAAPDKATFSNGLVSVADMSHFYPSHFVTGAAAGLSPADEDFVANLYGNMALYSLQPDQIKNAPQQGLSWTTVIGDIFNATNYWLFPFIESPPLPPNLSMTQGSPIVYTNRSINSTWSCAYYPVDLSSDNGSFTVIKVHLGGINSPATPIDIPSTAPEQSTFFTNNVSCGPRCGALGIFQASTKTPASFYYCNITVNTVTNATLPAHQVNDTMARRAAMAIALGSPPVGNTSYQRYPKGSYFGMFQQNNSDAIGNSIALFAIGSLAVAYHNNPIANISGRVPTGGYVLNVNDSIPLILIFALTCGLHFIFLVVATIIAGRVIVIDDSPLAVARLLSPIVTRLGSSGTLLTGEEICSRLKDEDTRESRLGEMNVIYTANSRGPEGVRRRLHLGDDGERERERFRRGLYD